ncbi:hypothetical protein [Nocardiopsis ansamitocini]|uniref:Uncharacterized protein n=1 Tax=Nocardiopsis ansamitocini TaxID=1670832 RepID=A0A9W6UJE8_9ACTN|nr:hypothetical protein [Nocardiopsis ansamitocini]GLU48754.1 hypothetical protein Nans01_31050 [Nocardiopsis ansamitocini]
MSTSQSSRTNWPDIVVPLIIGAVLGVAVGALSMVFDQGISVAVALTLGIAMLTGWIVLKARRRLRLE